MRDKKYIMTRKYHNFNVVSHKLAYTCLLACGVFFSKDAINQYFERKTAFQTTQQRLTLEDLPVVTVCYEGFDDHHDSFNSLGWTITYSLFFGVQDNEKKRDGFSMQHKSYR